MQRKINFDRELDKAIKEAVKHHRAIKLFMKWEKRHNKRR
jgi:hypothetical protein